MENRLEYMTKEQVEEERVATLDELKNIVNSDGNSDRIKLETLREKINYFLSNEHRWVKEGKYDTSVK